MQRTRALLVAATVAAAGLIGPGTGAADAAPATITVTTTADTVNGGDGVVSLREALSVAQNDGIANTVVLAPNTTYSLTDCSGGGGDLSYASDEALTITGNGALVDQTCANQRVMSLATPTAAIVINGLVVSGGTLTGQDGAGIWANAPLTITGSRFVDNHSSAADAEGGALRLQANGIITDTVFTQNSANNAGAVYAVGNVTLTDSAIVDNEADLTGGIHAADLTVINSTISDNVSTAHATGGIEADDVILRHATVSGNGAANFNRRQLVALGNLTANRSTVTDALSGTSNCSVAGTVTSQGFNYASDQTCGFTGGTDVPADGSANVAPAADNGGGTLTAKPGRGSPLLDAIPTANCDPTYTVDQRGTSRPQGSGCDIGAMEVQVLPPPPPPVATCDGRAVTVDLAMGQSPTSGNDVIRGTVGPDDVDGLGGHDRFCGLDGNDTFDGGPGADRAFGGRGADILRGQGGNDHLDGAAGNDRAFGQLGRDVVRGASGRDLVEGGPGNDGLNGGPQRDTCRGLAGTDTGTGCEVRIGIP